MITNMQELNRRLSNENPNLSYILMSFYETMVEMQKQNDTRDRLMLSIVENQGKVIEHSHQTRESVKAMLKQGETEGVSIESVALDDPLGK